jgi:hypothetical protein
MFSVVGVGSLILLLFVLKRKPVSRAIVAGSFAFIVGMVLQVTQFYNSTPNKLKKAILTPELFETVNAKRGRIQFIGFEHEIFVELESSSSLTKQLLNSRDYKLYRKSGYNSYDGPKWFPNKNDSDYKFYKYNSQKTEELYTVLVNKDSCEVFCFYLASLASESS